MPASQYILVDEIAGEAASEITTSATVAPEVKVIQEAAKADKTLIPKLSRAEKQTAGILRFLDQNGSLVRSIAVQQGEMTQREADEQTKRIQAATLGQLARMAYRQYAYTKYMQDVRAKLAQAEAEMAVLDAAAEEAEA
jgi:hypothetical protein